MMRAYKFRIYPSKEQEKLLNTHLWLAKNMWNELLDHCKQTYNDFGYFPTKNTLQLMVKDYGLYSQTQQEISHRVHNSVIRVFKLKKKGIKCGFPRFKSIERMKSLHYPQYEAGFWLDKKLKVTPFGEISIKKHREIKGKIKTLTLKRESSGKWFAIFCVETQKEIPKENIGGAVGIDLGLKNLATLSNGEIIKHPHQFRKFEKGLAFIQRKFSRKKKGKNRRKAKRKVSLIHEKIAEVRKDYLHKQANSLLSRYSFIAMEDLDIHSMAGEHGKNIYDASWGMFTNIICYKAEEAGSRIVFVDAEGTTKMCSRCGEKTEKTLWDRVHKCPSCGLVLDRDINAARNILIKATEGHSGSNACNSLEERDVAKAMSVKQEAHTYL
jgi:putative transposase